MQTRKSTWKWVAGLVATGAFGIFGLLVGALQNANAQTHIELNSRLVSIEEKQQDKAAVDAEQNGDIKYIKEAVTEIRELLKKK